MFHVLGIAQVATTVAATGGTSPYTYTWNTTPVQYTSTATNLVAGTYTVTVKMQIIVAQRFL